MENLDYRIERLDLPREVTVNYVQRAYSVINEPQSFQTSNLVFIVDPTVTKKKLFKLKFSANEYQAQYPLGLCY